MIKKIICTILLVCIFIENTSVFAAETNIFSMNDAIEFAKKHNYDLLLLNLQEDEANLNKEDEQDNLYDTIDEYNSSRSYRESFNFNNYKIKYGYFVKSAEIDFKNILSSIQNSQKQVEINIQQGYFNTVYKSKELENTKKTYESVKKQLDLAKAKFKAGQISEYDYNNLENQARTTETNYNKAVFEYKKQKRTMNQLLGKKITDQVTLSTDVFNQDYLESLKNLNDTFSDEKVVDAKVSEYVYSSISIDKLKDELELATEELRLDKAYYGKTDTTVTNLEKGITKKEMNIANEEYKLELTVRNSIEEYIYTYQSLEASKKNIELAEKNIQLTRKKYELGLITDIDVINAEISLDSLKNQYASLVNSLHIMALKLKYKI